MKDAIYALVFLVLIWMVLTDSKPSDLPIDEVKITVSDAADSFGDIADVVSDGVDRAKAASDVVVTDETVSVEIVNPLATIAPTPTLAPVENAFYSIDGNGYLDAGVGVAIPNYGPYTVHQQRTCAMIRQAGGIGRIPEPYKSLCGGD